MKIPSSVKIGGFDYKIIFGERDEEIRGDHCWGKVIHATREIHFDSTLVGQQLISTFTHEILHGVSDVYVANLEESQVSVLANGLLQIFDQLGISFEKGE